MSADTTSDTSIGSEVALFSAGFRPFFLLGALWAAGAMALWIAMQHGGWFVPSAFWPTVWHAHEMIYGFGAAIVAGFLLTAVPSWTGQPKLAGGWLAAFAGLWIAGRIAVALSAGVGAWSAAFIDLAFLAVLFARTLMQVVAGGNWRNLPITIALSVFLSGSVLAHAQAVGLAMTADLGHRLGIAVLVALIMLIGGRIVPTFTRNWLNMTGRGEPLPPTMGRFDIATIAIAVAALVSWLIAAESVATGALAAAAALAQALRLARWRGERTLAEPLVTVLHVGYGWLAAGFALMAWAAFDPTVLDSAPIHALTAGAMATMMMAMMTRATLGHTGRPLHADGLTVAIFALVFGAGVMRVLAPLLPGLYTGLVSWSAVAWIAAFALYAATYGPMLCRARAA